MLDDEDLERLCAIVSRAMGLMLELDDDDLYALVSRARRDVDVLIAERKLRRMPTDNVKPNQP